MGIVSHGYGTILRDSSRTNVLFYNSNAPLYPKSTHFAQLFCKHHPLLLVVIFALYSMPHIKPE